MADRLTTRMRLALLALAVAAVHLFLLRELQQGLLWPRGAQAERLAHLQLVTLQPQTPSLLPSGEPPAAPPAVPPAASPAPALPASAIPAPEPASDAAPEPLSPLPAASEPSLVPPPLVVAPVSGSVAAAAASAAADVVTVQASEGEGIGPVGHEWPLATRLEYTLLGHYRGPVHGSARVEWLRNGTRYQLYMTVTIGPAFAPVLERTIHSAGHIGPQGLRPVRFVQDTRPLVGASRYEQVNLEAPEIELPHGLRVSRPEGLQDEATQFVQLSWLLLTGRVAAQVGQSVRMPLLLPRRVDAGWRYGLVGEDGVQTPFGRVEALRVEPLQGLAPGELRPQAWLAPAYQFLPIKMRIEGQSGAGSWIELTLKDPPQQAAAPLPMPSTSAPAGAAPASR